MTNPARGAQTGATLIQLPDLRGGTALVTGASRGIGRAVVEALAAHDVRCFGLANDGFTSDLPPQVVPMPCDLNDTTAIEEVMAAVAAQTESLDYLVNVAGIDPKYQLEEGTVDIWDSIVDFFKKDSIWGMLIFVFFYRSSEGLLLIEGPLFLQASPDADGIGLTLKEKGIIDGTVSTIVANAGTAAGGRATDIPVADVRRVLDTNLLGVYLVAREGARRMIASGSRDGKVILWSVTTGEERYVSSGHAIPPDGQPLAFGAFAGAAPGRVATLAIGQEDGTTKLLEVTEKMTPDGEVTVTESIFPRQHQAAIVPVGFRRRVMRFVIAAFHWTLDSNRPPAVLDRPMGGATGGGVRRGRVRGVGNPQMAVRIGPRSHRPHGRAIQEGFLVRFRASLGFVRCHMGRRFVGGALGTVAAPPERGDQSSAPASRG